jgi:hypothetical protein
MRYELRLTAYDMLDQICVSAVVDGTPDAPGMPIERVLVRSAQAQGTGRSEATVWTREALETMLRAL